MSNIIKIHTVDIQVKEYEGKRVCTFRDIDTVHGKKEEVANRNFNRNRKYFIEGEDFFRTDCREAKETFNITAPNGLILITESGYLMLVKSFTDDLAWEVQRQLVNNYFRKPEPKPKEKSKLEQYEELYLVSLKNADISRDNKKAFYNAYLENEKKYREWLEKENRFMKDADFWKRQIENLKTREILQELSKISGI